MHSPVIKSFSVPARIAFLQLCLSSLRRLSLSSLGLLVLLLVPVSSPAEPATVEGATLILPVVAVGESGYYVELTIVEGTDPPELQLTAGELLDNPDFSDASSFIDGVLTVPTVELGDTPLWAQFLLVGDDPVIFRLLAANFDDLDDDDDGIPDTEDEFPYTPAPELVILPVVQVDQLSFYLELTEVAGSDPLELQFAFAELLSNPDTSNAAFFADGVLTVPTIEIDGVDYWQRFAFVGDDPITFRLIAEGIDDDDDDDDGIPDGIDPSPYIPAVSDPAGIAGTWNFNFRIEPANQVDNTACSEDPISTSSQIFIEHHPVNGYSVDTPFFDGPLEVFGNSISWSGTYFEEGGTTQSSVLLDILSPTRMEGDETWTWTASGEIPCNDIHSSITADKQ